MSYNFEYIGEVRGVFPSLKREIRDTKIYEILSNSETFNLRGYEIKQKVGKWKSLSSLDKIILREIK